MKVDVQAKSLFVLSFQVTCHLYYLEGFGIGKFAVLIKSPIQIFSKETCAIVACHNAIRIKHGHHINNEGAAQLPSYWFRTCQILQQSLSHKGRVGLAGVNASRYQYYPLVILRHFIIRNF